MSSPMVHRFTKVAVEREIMSRSLSVFLYQEDRDGRLTHVARFRGGDEVEFLPVQEGHVIPEPTLRLDVDVAEDLVGALVDFGIKPDRAARNEGELDATRSHLEDLRKLLALDGAGERRGVIVETAT